MKVINEKDYLLIQPDLNLDSFNKLDEKSKEKFLYMISNYQYYLELYLLSKTDLKKFDNNVKSSDLNFRLVGDEKKDYYQTYFGENLSYYYIRNNINIFALTNEEQELFINLIDEAKGVLSTNISEFIEQTFLKVIKENWTNTKINYGPLAENFFVENGTLIIGIRYDEFYPSDDENWDRTYDLQNFFLLQNNILLRKEIEDKLKIPCSVIRYNDFSVKKNDKVNRSKTI